jgi:hypothetical protein
MGTRQTVAVSRCTHWVTVGALMDVVRKRGVATRNGASRTAQRAIPTNGGMRAWQK